jgi:hypothetical protein
MKMSGRIVVSVTVLGFLLGSATAWAQLRDKQALSLSVAKKLAAVAAEEAIKNK